MKITKVCSFFGHRNANLTNEQMEELKKIIEDLIVSKDVKVFLFGSKSYFNSLCHKIVTDLKEKYPFIIRKCYTCQSESCFLEIDKTYWEKVFEHLKKEKVNIYCFEEKVEIESNVAYGRASYIERNKEMINNSDYCVFYYDKNYKPKSKKYSKQNVFSYTPKSGTALAYLFAKQKKKIIMNIYDKNI